MDEVPRHVVAADRVPVAPAEAVTVHATVHNLREEPLAGIRLVALNVTGQPSALSDAAGEITLVMDWAEVKKVRPQICSFMISGEGFTSTGTRKSFSAPGDEFLGHFKLAPGGVVTGRVVRGDGTPIEGAVVYCSEPTTGWSENAFDQLRIRRRRIHGGRRVTGGLLTGGDGRYRMEGVPPSTYSLDASAPGCFHNWSEAVDVVPGQTTEVPDLVLEEAPREYRIEGLVQNEDGTPRIGEGVSLLSPNGDSSSGGALTDARGWFGFVTEPGSLHQVRAGRTGHDAIFAYDVVAGTTDLLLRAEDRGSFVVHVATADGKKPGRIGADARFADGKMAPGSRGVSEDGSTVELTLPAREFHINVTAKGYRLAKAGPFDPGALPERIEVTLEPLEGWVGFVVADGKPVENAWVDVHVIDRNSGLVRLGNGLHERFSTSRSYRDEADAAGRFVIQTEYLTSNGARELHIHATAKGYSHSPLIRVELVPGRPLPELTLELTRGGSVEGRVVTPEGLDLRGRWMAISQYDKHIHYQRVDVNGTARFEHLATGRWQAVTGTEADLRIGARDQYRPRKGALPWNFEIVEGETTTFEHFVEPEPEETVRFAGRFLIDGAPPLGWEWRFEGKPGWGKPFDTEGRFEAAFVEAGPQQLLINSPSIPPCGYFYLSASVDLIHGNNTWNLDLVTASLLITSLPLPHADNRENTRRLTQGSWSMTWKDDSRGLTWSGTLACSPEGGLRLAQVPAGTLTIAKMARFGPIEGTEVVLELAPGEEREVHLEAAGD